MSFSSPEAAHPFSQHQKSRPLARSNTRSPCFTDFLSALNLLCLQSHSKPECHWAWPEVAILGADQKERGLWGRECENVNLPISFFIFMSGFLSFVKCYPILDPNALIYMPYARVNCLKTISFTAARTYIAHICIWQYSLSPGITRYTRCNRKIIEQHENKHTSKL